VQKASLLASLKSTGIGSNKNYRVGAVIFDKRGRVISSACNSYKTHPFVLKYSNYPFLHAETHAIIAGGLDNVHNCDIMITRVLLNGQPSMAKPCPSCQRALKDCGIRDVYYTDWQGSIRSYSCTT